MTYKVDHDHILSLLNRELDSYNKFQANIDRHIETLRTDLRTAEDQRFVDSLRYNKEMQILCLERAAVALEVIGLYSEDAGDTIDYPTIHGKVQKLCMSVSNTGSPDAETCAPD